MPLIIHLSVNIKIKYVSDAMVGSNAFEMSHDFFLYN